MALINVQKQIMGNINTSKRNFFRGRLSIQENLIAPPWTNKKYTDLCTRCYLCIDHCEESILIQGDGGFPWVNFDLGECTFCQACATSCKDDVFDLSQTPAWSLTAVIGEKCLAQNAVVCRSCEDQCDQQAIHFKLQTGGRATPIISQQDCNGCGACFATCPTKSIQIKEAI